MNLISSLLITEGSSNLNETISWSENWLETEVGSHMSTNLALIENDLHKIRANDFANIYSWVLSSPPNYEISWMVNWQFKCFQFGKKCLFL